MQSDAIGQHHPFELSESSQLSEFSFATSISGLTYWKTTQFVDDRGSYTELARFPEIKTQTGSIFSPLQMNLSISKTNVIRGIHAENWNKLLTITMGTIFAAWTDLRPDSSTYGATVTAKLGDDSELDGSMFVESGIGNSFFVLSGPAHYLYCVDQLYADRDSSGDKAVAVFDSDLNIPWPISNRDQVIISQRDSVALSFSESNSNAG